MSADNAINIAGRSAGKITLSTSVAPTATLESEPATYDVWSDVDMSIAVNSVTPNPALTLDTGYKIFAGSVVPVNVPAGSKIYAIAGGAGNMWYHRTN